MKIEGTQEITHPAHRVFAALRDKSPELVPYMPNVEAMEVLSREDVGPVAHLYNKWQGSMSEVPTIARPFVSRDIAAWFDRASWDESKLLCTWKLESVRAREIFDCNGTTLVTEKGPDHSTFTLTADLIIHAEKVPGVPRFLASKVQGPLERFIANALRPNLTSVASAVQKYLDDHPEG
ncbi:MAG: hypothetical protein IT371_24570 [Deltaproteobacteria bacterium]|nr:hypothetical protein [Deltaproteobacteria bacterium]